MAKSSVIKAVHFLKARLKADGLNVAKVILFGSQAKGRAKETSDIDVIIVSEDFHGHDIFKRADLTKDAEIMTIRKFIIPFDIITVTPDELESSRSLICDFARNGVAL
jgi:predicted nucleotidyltransferase